MNRLQPLGVGLGKRSLHRGITVETDDPMFLKYAVVARDVVGIDPVAMRVAELIRGSTKP